MVQELDTANNYFCIYEKIKFAPFFCPTLYLKSFKEFLESFREFLVGFGDFGGFLESFGEFSETAREFERVSGSFGKFGDYDQRVFI